MRNLVIFLLAVAVGWWYLGSSSTEAVVLPDGEFQYPDYRFEAIEPFSIEARVLSREDYRFGREADLSPTDLALGWGPMADEQVLRSFKIRQSNRWFTWRADTLPIPRSEIAASAANMHLIPASAQAAAQLSEVRTHDRIRLHGSLVDVSAADGWKWRSSRSRTDTGAGSCELLLLERIEWI
ncbi:MAG: hypothetical protein R3E82_04090 [Pseudomonadales bacterium]|nr:hypothetical protein [Pseudomonadales bacterium]